MITDTKLFAVYLGGRALKGNTELHDVVFVTGYSIEDTYEQLLDKWFGIPKGLHLDSWMQLDIVNGYKVALGDAVSDNGKKLYFVNLGAYRDGEFSEIHANKFLVADNAQEAKRRAKAELLIGWPGPVHTDDLYEVDDCIELDRVNAFHVTLIKSDEVKPLVPHNSYYLIPKAVVEDYVKRNPVPRSSAYREPHGQIYPEG